MSNNLNIFITKLANDINDVSYYTLHNGAYERFRQYKTNETIEEIKEYVISIYGECKIQIRKEITK